MNKFYSTLLLLFTVFTAIGQTKTVTINETAIKFGGITSQTCKHFLMINMETNDTINCVSISFQNAKYSKIIDVKTIMFSELDKPNFEKFKTDLKSAIENIEGKDEIIYKGNGYVLNVTGNKNLLLYDGIEQTSGYSGLVKKSAVKMLDWLNLIVF